MTHLERYERGEKLFYDREVAPVLPPAILDFHAHTWDANNWRHKPWESDADGGAYMVTEERYPPQRLLADGQRCFPDRPYRAVCFGYPTPAVDWQKDTDFVAAAARQHESLYPLVLAGPSFGLDRQRYEHALEEGAFYGFKILLDWYGDSYGDTRVQDMVGPVEIALANERRLVVLLHVPGSGRLADPVVQQGVAWLSRECPEASIVLAHCGRCFGPADMKAAIDSVADLPNVWMDTSMVMDPIVLAMAMKTTGPERLLFGTDFPVAAMRGRRVQVMDHWVDVVLPGYAPSAFRVAGDGIHATFMAWEIVLAIRWAAEIAGVAHEQLGGIFHDNGMRILKRVRGERWRARIPCTGASTV